MEIPRVCHVYLWTFCSVHSAKCDKHTFTVCPNGLAFLQIDVQPTSSFFFHVFPLFPLSPLYLAEDPSLRQGIVSDEPGFTGGQGRFSIDECPSLPSHNSYTSQCLELQLTFT